MLVLHFLLYHVSLDVAINFSSLTVNQQLSLQIKLFGMTHLLSWLTLVGTVINSITTF